MLLAKLVDASTAVTGTTGKLKKVDLLAGCLRHMDAGEHAIGARYLAGTIPQKTGVGHATVYEVANHTPPASHATLTIVEIDRRLTAIAALSGSGSGRARKDSLGSMLALATAAEQKFLAALAVGGLRQGAVDGLVVEAIAKAVQLPAADVRRAYMLAGDLGVVAAAALTEGEAGLARFGLTVFRPVLPMLAQTADDATSALATLAGPAIVEHKLDGFRLQVHKDGDVIRAYSRGLNDVTSYTPEIISAVAALPARRLILDGEAICFGALGRPRPFQDTMRRFGKTGVAHADKIPLTLSAFDALLVDDQTLIAEPAQTRLAALDALAPGLTGPRSPAFAGSLHLGPRLVTSDPTEATAFYERAIASGHEGVMAKAIDAPYDAGSRGASWLKIKKVRRLDLVVLAAEWGSGRRRGWLSNIHMGARDGSDFVMLGKTFKGMTDEMLRWQTEQLLAREVDRDGHIVFVRPELVVEIAFNDVQRSSQYPGGLALRFARVVRYRDDKTVAQADTIDAVRAIAIADGVVAS